MGTCLQTFDWDRSAARELSPCLFYRQSRAPIGMSVWVLWVSWRSTQGFQPGERVSRTTRIAGITTCGSRRLGADQDQHGGTLVFEHLGSVWVALASRPRFKPGGKSVFGHFLGVCESNNCLSTEYQPSPHVF